MHREHPLRIIRYSIKNIWLLIFPLLRGVYTFPASPEAMMRWMHGAWFDLLILFCILGFSWLRWLYRQYTVRDGDIYVREGILFRRCCYMPVEHLSALTLEAPFWLVPLGGMYLFADTAAGLRSRTDIRLLIRKKDAALFEVRLPKLQHGSRRSYRYRVHPWRIFGFSVIFSSSFYGSVYAAAFWFQGGRISRDLIEEFRLTERLTQVSEEVAARLVGIPPAAIAVGIVTISMWLLSLFTNLFRYSAFTLETDKRQLCIRSGLLKKRRHYLQTDKINFLDIRQNLPARLCGLHSLALNCPGYGNGGANIPVCLPLLTGRELEETLPLLFPGAGLAGNRLKAPLTAWWGFVWLPVLLTAAILPAAEIAGRLFPTFETVIDFFRLMLLIPILWKLAVQVTALLTSGVSLEDSRICLRFCRGVVFHTIVAGTERVVKVRIRRQLWQRLFGKCHVDFYFRSEAPARYVLANVDYRKARALLSEHWADLE